MLLFLATFHTLLWLDTQAVEGKDSDQIPGPGYLTAIDGSVDMPVSLMLKLEPEGGRPGNFVGGHYKSRTCDGIVLIEGKDQLRFGGNRLAI
jgi:hypothetical protein